jgi:hypothetical protein
METAKMSGQVLLWMLEAVSGKEMTETSPWDLAQVSQWALASRSTHWTWYLSAERLSRSA